MGNSKALLDFSNAKYTDAALGNRVNFIIDKMTDNDNFAAPVPSLAELKAANDSYVVSLAKTANGSKVDTVIKNTNRKTLLYLLKELGTYVQSTSKGDEAVILSSGYDVNKKPAAVGMLSKPENFVLKHGGNKGTVELLCDPIKYADFYQFEYIDLLEPDDSKWNVRTSTKRKILLEGLTSGRQYAFRVAAAASHPARVWSEKLISFVL